MAIIRAMAESCWEDVEPGVQYVHESPTWRAADAEARRRGITAPQRARWAEELRKGRP